MYIRVEEENRENSIVPILSVAVVRTAFEFNPLNLIYESLVLRRVKKSARRTLMSDRQGPSVVRETLDKPKAHHKPSLVSLQEP